MEITMILIDASGHMVSTESESELHTFAAHLGLRRDWYQEDNRPHYDLTTTRMRLRAKYHGAVVVSKKMLVQQAWWSRLPIKGKHTDSEYCWCDPAIEIMENGNKVVIHRRDDN